MGLDFQRPARCNQFLRNNSAFVRIGRCFLLLRCLSKSQDTRQSHIATRETSFGRIPRLRRRSTSSTRSTCRPRQKIGKAGPSTDMRIFHHRYPLSRGHASANSRKKTGAPGVLSAANANLSTAGKEMDLPFSRSVANAQVLSAERISSYGCEVERSSRDAANRRRFTASFVEIPIHLQSCEAHYGT